jgi:NagD protein
MTDRGPLPSFLMDMDGVLVHEEQAIPGADRFIKALQAAGLPFLVLTNNSIYTQRDLAARLARSGIELAPERIWTSALATAQFLDTQRPGGTAYVIGEAGLTTALHQVGYTLTERDPDYVVLGETRSYSLEAITRAIRLIMGGARFIATNRPHRALAGRTAAGHRVGGRAHLQGHRDQSLLRGQAEPADDAHGPAGHRRPFRGHGDDR